MKHYKQMIQLYTHDTLKFTQILIKKSLDSSNLLPMDQIHIVAHGIFVFHLQYFAAWILCKWIGFVSWERLRVRIDCCMPNWIAPIVSWSNLIPEQWEFYMDAWFFETTANDWFLALLDVINLWDWVSLLDLFEILMATTITKAISLFYSFSVSSDSTDFLQFQLYFL